MSHRREKKVVEEECGKGTRTRRFSGQEQCGGDQKKGLVATVEERALKESNAPKFTLFVLRRDQAEKRKTCQM